MAEQNPQPKPGKMSDEERQALIRKMDEDLQDFIEDRKAAHKENTKTDEPYNKTVEDLVKELKYHPAFMTEFDPSQEMSPEMEGLQQLKYESDSAYTNADSYKDDGNYNFKKKKYRWANDSYTKGITEKSSDRELNAILYSNRAAAQYHLGNFRSSFTDCILSRKFKPDHVKVIHRGVLCCIELKRYADAIKWCDNGLLPDAKDEKFLALRARAIKLQKLLERDQRKESMKERKQKQEQQKLIQTIQERGVRLADLHTPPGGDSDSLVLSSLESKHPSGAKVNVGSDGALSWPVLLVYPEYGQTDLIESFSENSTFGEHLDVMFGEENGRASWDEHQKYKPRDIQLYFEDKDEEKLFPVNKNQTLHKTLKHKRYVVYGGTPSFIIIVKDSAFAKHFLAKFKS